MRDFEVYSSRGEYIKNIQAKNEQDALTKAKQSFFAPMVKKILTPQEERAERDAYWASIQRNQNRH